MEQPTACAACGAQVGPEEIAQGLAVKVSGRLLCPLCLDRLPGDAKVMVNQMRALRGMAVTTYRFYSGRHPRLPLYTFTTAPLLLAHRRKLVHGEPFEAPPLPPPGSRPRMPSASEAARGDRTGWTAVAGVSILIITGVVWLMLPGTPPPRPEPAAPQPPAHHAADPVELPSQPTPTRAQPTPAMQLRELEERLRRHPDQARAIADEAELLRDRLEPRDINRKRAEALVADATAAMEAARPQPPAPVPTPAPQPQPADAQPVAEPVPPVAVPQAPQPAPQPASDPVPATAKPQPAPAPAPEAAKPVQQPVVAPEPAKPAAKPGRGDGPTRAEIAVVWPKAAKPLVEPDGVPLRREIPWPWPTGEAIHAGAMDTRNRQRRLAIELSIPGTSPVGGVAVVLHPGKAERQNVLASWTDGTKSTPPWTLVLDGQRWQTVAIPSAGTEELDPEQMRLRIEDAKDLSDQRPFLVAGASVRWDAAPTAADHPLRIPLVMPPGYDAANGWSLWRAQLLKRGKGVIDQRFAFARAKVLLPLSTTSGGKFGSALRASLADLQRVDKVPNGTLADLPWEDAEFANPQAAWPGEGMADLDRHPAAAIGWRAVAWGDDADLEKRTIAVLGKLLSASQKPRRPAAMPLLVIGEVDFASQAQREAIDRRWGAVAERIAALGVPVIDLRPAQAEHGTEEVQRTTARLLVDALRQLDWILKP